MKCIPLTQNQIALIDDEDYDRVAQFRWRATRVEKRFYAARYIKPAKGIYRIELLHRFIMGARPGQQIDHINGDCLDCRRSNLRFATDAQNQHNRGKHCDNTSGYKGVDWMKSKQRWRARITAHKQNIHLGLFDTPEDAARAYDAAALIYHRDFAHLNFSPEPLSTVVDP